MRVDNRLSALKALIFKGALFVFFIPNVAQACRCINLPPAEWVSQAESLRVVQVMSRAADETFQVDGSDRVLVRHRAQLTVIETLKGAPTQTLSVLETAQEFQCEPRLIVGEIYVLTRRAGQAEGVTFCDIKPQQIVPVAQLRSAAGVVKKVSR